MDFLNLEKCSLPSEESYSASLNDSSALEEDKDTICDIPKTTMNYMQKTELTLMSK